MARQTPRWRSFTLALLAAAPLQRARAAAPAPSEIRPQAEFAAFGEAMQKTTRGCTVDSAVGPVKTPLTLGLSNFLLDHPDLAAYLVNLHKIAPYRIAMRGRRQSTADDGEGTKGIVTLVDRNETRRIYYGEGTHESSIFPTIHASAVIVMNLESPPDERCRPSVATSFYVYVRLRNPVLATLVKALRPFLKKTIVGKFTKAFLVADKVGRLMAADPEGIAREIRASPLVTAADGAVFQELLSRLKRDQAACP